MREKYVAELHRRLYTEEYSWGPAFIGYAAGIAMDFAKKEKNSREELFIAEYRGIWPGVSCYARQMTMMSASSVSLPLKKAAAATGSARR